MDYLHFFTELGNYIESIILAGGYVFVFLFTVLEGIPLLGMLVPGHVAIVLAGFFSKIGLMNVYWAGSLALSGAILGDWFGYFLGKKYGMPFIDRFRPYFFIKDEYIEKAKKILTSHTGKALLIGRFSPMTRAIMPFLVGCSGVHKKTFWFYNVVGAVSWVASSFFIGYVFGSGYHFATAFFGKFVLFSILSAILIIWGYRFINKRFHIFKRFELIMLGLNFLSLYALAKTIQDAWSLYSFMAKFDVWVNMYVEQNVTSAIVFVSKIVSSIGSVTVLLLAGIIVGIYLVFRREYRYGLIMMSSVIFTGLFTGFLKEIFMRMRPDNQFVQMLLDPSFPSGHSAMAGAFFVAMLYVTLPRMHSWVKRELLIVCFTFAIIVVGVSRIALNVHWFSDVLAGWALGIFVATGSVLFVRYIGALVKR